MPLRLTCLLLMALYAPNAFSQEADPESEAIVFMTADVWPWGYFDANAEPDGLISEFARRLADVAGLPLNNRVLPHQRLLVEFKRGQGDFTVVFENPKLNDVADSIGVVLKADILLVAKSDYTGELSLAALEGKRVGYISGTYYGEAFQHNDTITKIPVYNLDQAMEMLHIDRLDALISSDVVFYHSLKSQSLQANQFRYEVHARNQAAHLYMSHLATNRHLAPRLQAALEHLHQTGELRTLFYSQLRSGATTLPLGN